MNAAFSEIQDGAFSHLPLLQFLYGWGLMEGRVGHGRRGQMLGWGAGEWVVQPLEMRMSVSFCSFRIGHKRWSSLGS